MQFTVRAGTDPVARADRTLLRALGLPSGGAVRIGDTVVLIRGDEMTEPSAIELGPLARANAGVALNASVDVTRAVLSTARLVVIGVDSLPADGRTLVRALQGRPLSAGDAVVVPSGHIEGIDDDLELVVERVEPDTGGLVGSATRFVDRTAPESPAPLPDGRPAAASGAEPEQQGSESPPVPAGPSTSDALLAGLEAELDLLSGWFTLLTSPKDLPAAWGLPAVAGILMEGPYGCGKSELVTAAADAAGATVHEVSVDMVFKPDRLLDLLEAAVKSQTAPAVVFVDRLEAVTGEDAMAPFRSQVGAILRWFLDAVAERPGIACVLGVSSRSHLDEAIRRSPLLPRTLSVPPPDLTRRELLLEATLGRVPKDDLDYALLASRSAGFSGADIVAAAVHASARIAGDGGRLTTEHVLSAIEETTPSLGSVPMGEMPSYGFDRVANLIEVKQRLTEAVIWPVSDPERFRGMGIDPPRGILLYGPPGTGKTFVIRALAHEAGAAFFSVKGAELLDKYVGESERGVREVFARARAAAPAIIFFDEFDALAPVRGRSTNSVTDSVVAALLTEIDGVGARGEVAVIGATNRRDLIDPALLRAGRFEIQIELGLPEPEARRALLGITDIPFADDVDLDQLAHDTSGMSFADITGVLREAALTALRRDDHARTVTRSDIDVAIDNWRSTRE